MFNKKSKVISKFNQLLDELNNVTNTDQGNTWKASLKDLIGIYIGTESSIFGRIDNLVFTREESHTVPGIIGIFTEDVFDDSKKASFRDLIQSAIRHIELNGVSTNRLRTNILSGFSNTELISGIVVAIGIIYGIGNYLGKLEKDREIINNESKTNETEKKYQELLKENKTLKGLIEKTLNGK